MKNTQPVLIISTGRTGTQFFARLFSDIYPQVDAYHERGQSRQVQIATHLYFSGFLSLSGLIRIWTYFKGREIETCPKPFHIDANSFLYGLAMLAPEVYPNLKVVHIVRDPRTYLTSHLNYAVYHPTSFVGNYLFPFWQPNPFLVKQIPWRRFFTLSRFEKYAWIWNFKNNVIDQIENSETHYLRVRFEDAFDPQAAAAAFRQITDFIGLPPAQNVRERFRKAVNQAPKQHFPEWPDWTAEQCALLQTHCGNRMKKYQYGVEPAWQKKLEQAPKKDKGI